MKKRAFRIAALIAVLSLSALITGCQSTSDSSGTDSARVVIYTPTEDYLIEYVQGRLEEAFPEYEIVMEYYHSADLAAKLTAEGADTECNIIFDCEYGYLQSLSDNLAVIDFIDQEQFVDDVKDENLLIMPVDRYSGSIVVNTELLAELDLEIPQSYEDLLQEEYQGLIEMPAPDISSTGYLFLKSLVNAWGEDEAFAYFDKLDANILQYTSGGSTPIKDLTTGECAIGLGLTFKAVELINEGYPLQILFFEEGAPYTASGLSIISGSETNQAVVDVVTCFYNDILDDYLSLYLPEQIKVDQVNSVENYPTEIPYADMSNNTPDVKESLLARWDH